ncbi:MAG: hypothetical protein AAF479_00275 [Pseudomonadota bacterium]
MSALDSILPIVYREFDVPADQIVTNAELGDRFVDIVRRNASGSFDKMVVLRRLITLRKRGLLPRLRR